MKTFLQKRLNKTRFKERKSLDRGLRWASRSCPQSQAVSCFGASLLESKGALPRAHFQADSMCSIQKRHISAAYMHLRSWNDIHHMEISWDFIRFRCVEVKAGLWSPLRDRLEQLEEEIRRRQRAKYRLLGRHENKSKASLRDVSHGL